MSDYTPTLEDAKRTYAYIQGGLDHDEGYKPFYQVHEEAFDRMIAEVERAAAEKAWDEGYSRGNAHNGRRDDCPYRAAEIRERKSHE